MIDRWIDRLIFALAFVACCAAVASGAERISFLPSVPKKVVFCAPAVSEPEPVRETYPLRKSWWTVNGGYPEREVMQKHLQTGLHAGKFSQSYLEGLTYEELHSLHSDDHEGRLAGQKREKQIVVVTAPWCGPCQTWKRTERKRLEKAGWTFGGDGHFKEVGSFPGVNSYPSFVLTVNGKAVSTLSGFKTAEQLADLWGR